jgi:hypothetical protein
MCQLLAAQTQSGFVSVTVCFSLCRYAPSYDQLDGGAASSALGFPELRQQLLQQVCNNELFEQPFLLQHVSFTPLA